MIQELVWGHKIDQAQIQPFPTRAIQEHDGGDTLDLISFQQAVMNWIILSGNVHLDHGKLAFGLLDDIRMTKSDRVKLPAGATPFSRKIYDYRPVGFF